MLSRILVRLQGLGLAVDLHVEGGRRLALSDRGLAMLARRDRSSVGAARKRWSVTPADPKIPLDWRNVSGRRSRQLLRNVEHTDAVHWFVAVLERQAHSRSRAGRPPRPATTSFDDTSGTATGCAPFSPTPSVSCAGEISTWPFFLEWERRAVRPTTMAARIAPYLRYYSSHRPTDDHGVQPSVLVAFEDEIAQTHFLRVARDEMARTGVTVPLFASHRSLLERVGPLGRAWSTPQGSEPDYAF